MKKLLAFVLLSLASFSANAVLITDRDINSTGIDYTYFSIDMADTIRIETFNGQFDPMMYLFIDDGALDAGDYLAVNDDGGTPALFWYNSLIDIALGAGNYVAAVGTYWLSTDEAISGVADNGYLNATYDIEITAANGATITVADDAVSVPEPASIALLGLGLVGLSFARRRKAR